MIAKVLTKAIELEGIQWFVHVDHPVQMSLREKAEAIINWVLENGGEGFVDIEGTPHVYDGCSAEFLEVMFQGSVVKIGPGAFTVMTPMLMTALYDRTVSVSE